MKKLSVGDHAPLFSLPDSKGNIFNLEEIIGKKYIILYFYPKDETPGCTKEACLFRDSFTEFEELDAEIIGISADSEESHSVFSNKLGLPFKILSDSMGTVHKIYGLKPSFFGMLPPRVTFLIDKSGKIQEKFSSQIDIAGHIEIMKKVLKSLNA